MKNSLTRKLLLAVITLGIAVIATVGSTYAWFSMNTTVEATGMQLTAVTPVNVVISDEETGTYTNAIAFDTLTENLYPASTDITLLTSSGFSFWAVKEGQVIGSNGEGGQAEEGSDGTIFQSSAIEANGQYVIAKEIWLKTTAGKVDLRLESISIADAVTPSSGTVSHAVESYDIANAVYVALITNHETYIYAVNGETGTAAFQGILSVESEDPGDFTKAASAYSLSTASSSGTLIFGSDNAIKLGTTPEKVTVLVWVEGEDPQCVNGIGGLGLSIGLTFGYAGGFVEE